MCSYEGVLSSGDVSTETNPSKSKFRQATFSIDSIDPFSPGSLPVIAGFGGVNSTEFATVRQTALVEMEGSGISQGDGGSLLSKAALDDPELPITSMLRKLGCQIETVEGRSEHEKFLESFRFVF